MTSKHRFAAIFGSTVILAAAATPPVSPGWAADTPAVPTAVPLSATDHAAEATRYDREATDLETKASRHEAMAAQYGRRISGGGRDNAALRTIQIHCEGLATAYRSAAAEARQLAAAHRQAAAED